MQFRCFALSKIVGVPRLREKSMPRDQETDRHKSTQCTALHKSVRCGWISTCPFFYCNVIIVRADM